MAVQWAIETVLRDVPCDGIGIFHIDSVYKHRIQSHKFHLRFFVNIPDQHPRSTSRYRRQRQRYKNYIQHHNIMISVHTITVLLFAFVAVVATVSADDSSIFGVSRQLAPPTPLQCADDAFTKVIPTIDIDSSFASIDGVIGTDEYDGFLSLPMYNAGKNNDPNRQDVVATAYIAYDCSTKTLCVATNMTDGFLRNNTNTEVQEASEHSWVELDDTVDNAVKFNPDGGSRGYSGPYQFQYVYKEGSDYTIGYEGTSLCPLWLIILFHSNF